MKCPHCLAEFNDIWAVTPIAYDAAGFWHSAFTQCSTCHRVVIRLGTRAGAKYISLSGDKEFIPSLELVYPKTPERALLSPDVPENIAQDYREACGVLPVSPKASAALSRRCLQNLLREKAGVKPSDLNNEIRQVLDGAQLPTYLAKAIDAVRTLGNFGAHPTKSTNTGEIIAVEPGEPERQLEALESLFDFYFVQPATLHNKRDADAKDGDAGK